MKVDSIEFEKLNDLFWRWLSINDLDQNVISDPERMAAFGFYVAQNEKAGLIDEWDVREFVRLQIDSNDMFGEMQRNKIIN